MDIRRYDRLRCILLPMFFLLSAAPSGAQESGGNAWKISPPLRSERPRFAVGLTMGQQKGVVLGMKIWRYGVLEAFAGMSDLGRVTYREFFYGYADRPAPAFQLAYAHHLEYNAKRGVELHAWLGAGGLAFRHPAGGLWCRPVLMGVFGLEAPGLPLLFRFECNIVISWAAYGNVLYGGGYSIGAQYKFE